jgi:hypothetical protein
MNVFAAAVLGIRLARKLNIVTCLTAENLVLRHQLIVLKRNLNRAQQKEAVAQKTRNSFVQIKE